MMFYNKFINSFLDVSNNVTLEVKPNGVLAGMTPEAPALLDRADELSEIIIKEVSFYKNSLLPEIKENFKTVTKNIARERDRLLSSGLTLIPVVIPSDIQDEKFDFIESYPYMEHETTLDSLNGEAVRNIIGDVKYMDKISNGKLEDAWDKYFKDFSPSNRNISSAVNINFLDLSNVDDAYIIYYILKALVSKDIYPSGTSELEDYRSNRRHYYNYIKRTIAKRIEKVKASTARDILILGTREKTILVNGVLLSSFKSNGGTIDSILGTHYKQGLIHSETIIANRQELEDLQAKAYMAYVTKCNTQVNQLTHDAILSIITGLVRNLENPDDKYKEVKDYVNALNTSAYAEPIRIIEAIYAEILYPRTNLKEFLTLTRQYSETLTVKHAVTLAISDMVATYLLNGVTVIKD